VMAGKQCGREEIERMLSEPMTGETDCLGSLVVKEEAKRENEEEKMPVMVKSLALQVRQNRGGSTLLGGKRPNRKGGEASTSERGEGRGKGGVSPWHQQRLH